MRRLLAVAAALWADFGQPLPAPAGRAGNRSSLGAARKIPAAAVEAEMARLCALWPVPGSRGCGGLLHAPLAQDARTAALLGEKLRRAAGRGAFVVAAFGDSITAGHDNFYNQSWVPQLTALLGPFLAAFGVDLVVENFAVGNIGEYPFSGGCLRSRLGETLARTADVLTWNWAMYGDPDCAMEQFLMDAYAPEKGNDEDLALQRETRDGYGGGKPNTETSFSFSGTRSPRGPSC